MPTKVRGEDLRRLIGRLDPDCIRHFQGATTVCMSRAHFEVAPDHLLLRLLDETTGDVTQIFSTFKVDRAPLRRGLQKALDAMRTGHSGKPAVSSKLVELFQSADVMADELGMEQIRSGLLILAMVLNPGLVEVGEFTPELARIDVDQLRDHFFDIVSGPSEAPSGVEGGGGPVRADGGALAQFTIDVTAKAAAGEIDPVFGRDHEIRQMIDVFARRRKNNPILVGEPGTGKTAIVEGLALRMVEGDVPPVLKGCRLISLDMGLLQAGASVKGEFENRLKNVIKEIKASESPVITFIDEAHTLIGAGGQAGGGDAANLLKPALARGELRTVAATTWAEYKKYFEKDAALERRFQLIRCDEPSIADAIVMLRGLKEKYEKHHKIFMSDDAVSAAVSYSKRYISGRFLPDKAVDLLDTAAARVAVSLSTRPARLDDIDRELGYLDTALLATRRDIASAVAEADEEQLGEMDARREVLIKDRETFEKRWQDELAAINRIRELRGKLPGYAAVEQSSEGDEAKTPVKLTEAEEKALRQEIAEATKALEAIQGEDPLLQPHVNESSVAAVVADWTGVPVGKMVKDEVTATLQMEERIRERIVGQDHAIKIIAQKLRTSKAGLGNPDQPKGVFLCVGPSGVGKTEMALSVADLLFGGEKFLTTINMSEFMEKHTVSQLKGSPPGYVGYGEGGVLTEAVRQHPYSLVLLDEVEKAHPDVMNLFYQVFDKGSLADGEGRVIDFRNTVLFLTSNLGTDVIQQMCESGEDVSGEDLAEAIYPHLREHFKPALVARMTVIPFMTLGQEVLKSIARMKVGKIVKRLSGTHKMELRVDDSVYTQIASQCTELDVGARNIDHILDKHVLPDLSRRLLEMMTEEKMPKAVTMTTAEAGEFTYTFSD